MGWTRFPDILLHYIRSRPVELLVMKELTVREAQERYERKTTAFWQGYWFVNSDQENRSCLRIFWGVRRAFE